MNRIRVLVGDDHIYAVEGLRTIIANADDMEVVGQALTLLEVVTKTEQLKPDVVILDMSWGGDKAAGVSAIPQIKQKCPATRVVAISVYPELVEAAGRAGAWPLNKGFSIAELLDKIRWAMQTEGTPPNPKELDMFALTERELEVVKLITLPDKQIAQTLNIQIGTAKKHVSSILGKLGAANRAEAAVIAERNKLM